MSCSRGTGEGVTLSFLWIRKSRSRAWGRLCGRSWKPLSCMSGLLTSDRPGRTWPRSSPVFLSAKTQLGRRTMRDVLREWLCGCYGDVLAVNKGARAVLWGPVCLRRLRAPPALGAGSGDPGGWAGPGPPDLRSHHRPRAATAWPHAAKGGLRLGAGDAQGQAAGWPYGSGWRGCCGVVWGFPCAPPTPPAAWAALTSSSSPTSLGLQVPASTLLRAQPEQQTSERN